MKLTRKLFVFALVALMFAACDKDVTPVVEPGTEPTTQPTPEEPTKEISAEFLEEPYNRVYPDYCEVPDVVCTFKTQGVDDVKVDEVPGIKFTVSKENNEGTLWNVKITPVGEFDVFTMHVTFRNSNNSTFLEKQFLKAFISIEEKQVNMPKESGYFHLDISATVPYEVLKSGEDGTNWCYKSDGKWYVKENTVAMNGRSVTLTFTDEMYGKLKQTVVVTQEGCPDYFQLEREALIAIYRSMNGENWERISHTLGTADIKTSYWCTDKPVSQWYGIECDSDGHVKYVHLHCFMDKLAGPIPEEIGNLKWMTECIIWGQIEGNIPEAFNKCEKLTDLNLSCSGMSGRLDEIDLTPLVKHLHSFVVGGNNFTGGCPEWLGDLHPKGYFSIEDCRLTGKVPEKVKNHPYWNKVIGGPYGNMTRGQRMMIQQEGYGLWE